MAELLSLSPFGTMAPVQIGRSVLTEPASEPVHAIMPYEGADEAASQQLLQKTGLALPEPGRSTKSGDLQCLWSGRAQALLVGDSPPLSGLAETAAVVDVSDVWARLRLSGPDQEDVLARLTPLDLHPGVFRVGYTARTDVQHMAALLVRLPSAIDIWVMRSMAGTLKHDLCSAMRAVAARASLAQ